MHIPSIQLGSFSVSVEDESIRMQFSPVNTSTCEDFRNTLFQNEIFEALKINYGEPFDNNTWTRGTEALKAKCWMGEKTYAAIVAPTFGAWDAVILYDQAANQKAREYADTEPARAAKDFSTNGFKTLTMGMKLDVLPSSSVSGFGGGFYSEGLGLR